MEAQGAKTVIERALVSFTGTSTSNGNAGGTTVVCSALTGRPDYDGQSILIDEGTYAGQIRDINGATTGGTVTVEPAFGGQIVSGINFHILTGIPSYSELLDIMGGGFDTSTDSLIKIHDDHVSHLTADYGSTEKAAIDLLDDAGYGLQALDTELGLIPQSGGSTTWNATALASIQGECTNAIEADALDHLMAAADGAGKYPASAANDSAIAKILSKNDPAASSSFDNTTDSLEAIRDALDTHDTDIKTDIGDFSGQTHLQTLLAALGVPDVSSKPLYTCLVTDRLDNATYGLAALNTDLDEILADTGTDGVVVNSRTSAYSRLVGVAQIAATTIDLNQAAATYDLFTGTTQAVIVESLVFRLPNVDVSDDATITSISIQTDETTAQTIISAADGAKANLTAEAQLAYTGAIYIPTGAKIQLTIAGGAADATTTCNVVAKCRAVVSGGYLA